jgi:hypothetical protein
MWLVSFVSDPLDWARRMPRVVCGGEFLDQRWNPKPSKSRRFLKADSATLSFYCLRPYRRVLAYLEALRCNWSNTVSV